MSSNLKNILKEYALQLGFIFSNNFIMIDRDTKEVFQKSAGINHNIGLFFNTKYFVEYKVIKDEFYYIIWKNGKMIYACYSYLYMSTKKECYYPTKMNEKQIVGRLKRPFLFYLFHNDFKRVKEEAYSIIQKKYDIGN